MGEGRLFGLFPPGVRSTNWHHAIESLNVRYRRPVNARGHFRPSRPDESVHPEVPLPRHLIPRPTVRAPSPMDAGVKSRPEYLRPDVREPAHADHDQLTTLKLVTPEIVS